MQSQKEKKERVFFSKIKQWKMPSLDIFKWKKDNQEGDKKVKVKNEKISKAQYSVGTNLLNWAYFGTANLEFNASLGNKVTVFAGGKYNPFQFMTKGQVEVFNNKICGYAGVKWWPWLVNTGWWIGIKGQYCDFSTSGILTRNLKEGIAVGGGLSGGYSFMLNRHFNLDLGIGAWGGTYLEYTDYSREAKPGMFVEVDNIQVSLTYIF